MKKLMAWIKMSGGRMFAALFILTLGLLMFTLSAAYKADNNKDMNSLIDEIGYLGLNSEFPEVRLRMETKQRELAAQSAKGERYKIMTYGGSALLWAALTMLLTQFSMWLMIKLPGTRTAIVGSDGKLNDKEQSDYMRLLGTVYMVAGISLALILNKGGVL
jgi:hypothetical protein